MWTPLHVDAAGEVQTARGALTIHGVTKADVGTGSNFEASKGCVSDALKRCAVLWGVARYLYAIPSVQVTLDGRGRISEADLAKLREALRRRSAGAPPARPRTPPDGRQRLAPSRGGCLDAPVRESTPGSR